MTDQKVYVRGELVVYKGPQKQGKWYERIGEVMSDDGEKIQIKFSKTETPIMLKMAIQLARPTADEIVIAKFKESLAEFEFGDVYLRWLRDGGDGGVYNDCTCLKNEYYNKTCTCRTLVKLNHRFSTIKDKLVNDYGYQIDDERMTNGKHKTILRFEPLTFKKELV